MKERKSAWRVRVFWLDGSVRHMFGTFFIIFLNIFLDFFVKNLHSFVEVSRNCRFRWWFSQSCSILLYFVIKASPKIPTKKKRNSSIFFQNLKEEYHVKRGNDDLWCNMMEYKSRGLHLDEREFFIVFGISLHSAVCLPSSPR